MKRFTVVPALLAALLVATVAFAARDKVEASFEALAASGVGGEVTLSAMPQGGTQVHGKVRGLQPNTEYVSQIFIEGACAPSPGTELARFRANPAGIAVFNARTDRPLAEIRSISVQLGTDLTLQACASVSP